MEIAILGSGSNGNATLVKLNNQSFLIDNGLTFKSFYSRLESCGYQCENIKSVFITHEHGDHVSGVRVMLKKMPMKCYLTNGTYRGLNDEIKVILDLNEVEFVKGQDEIYIENVKITIINLHHDANETIGFVIEEDNKKVVYITDTGYVDQRYYPLLENADLYIVESNYDVELLWSSDRRFDLKKRIDGDHGHMSNVASAVMLAKVIGPNTKNIIFAHISDDCNYYMMPELILKEHKKIYDELGVDYSKISFDFGNRNGVTGVYKV